MKITIIGAGNIGSAVAACLAKGHLYNEKDIIISTPHTDKLENLHKQFPAIRIMTENQYAISEADIIILAVKPCIVDEVLSPLRFSRTQILVSLVTGISIFTRTFIGNRNAYIPGSFPTSPLRNIRA